MVYLFMLVNVDMGSVRMICFTMFSVSVTSFGFSPVNSSRADSGGSMLCNSGIASSIIMPCMNNPVRIRYTRPIDMERILYGGNVLSLCVKSILKRRVICVVHFSSIMLTLSSQWSRVLFSLNACGNLLASNVTNSITLIGVLAACIFILAVLQIAINRERFMF